MKGSKKIVYSSARFTVGQPNVQRMETAFSVVSDGQRVRLRVEHVLIQIDLVPIVTEQQIKVFQRFAQPETFHHVSRPGVERVFNISDGRIPVLHFGILVEGLKDGPTHVLIGFVTGDGVEVV